MSASTLPFLRWAGGKRWIAPTLAPTLSKVLVRRYIEPFLGAGAVFFVLRPETAILSDVNADLIEVYKQVALHPKALQNRLSTLPVDATTYYRIRADIPARALDRVVRFVYLNRTCYGGLHRTNRAGKFNVPYGGGSRTPECVYQNNLLVEAAKALRRPRITVIASDFARSIEAAGAGDVVFCDPTYQSVGRGRFDRYGPTIFSWDDQIRLVSACRAASRRGAVVLIMNADNRDLHHLYADATFTSVVFKRKNIGHRASDESRHREFIAVFDAAGRHEIWAELQAHIDCSTHDAVTNVAGAA